MRIIGIDPGLDGAAALVYDEGSRFSAFSFPKTKAKGRGNEMLWAAFPDALEWLCFEADHAFLEKVMVRPAEGASSGFKFGTCFGGIRGMITMLRIPVTLVTPPVWKLSMGLGQNKDAAVARAAELFPNDIGLLTPERGVRNKKQIEGIAEAALIGYYGYTKLRSGK